MNQKLTRTTIIALSLLAGWAIAAPVAAPVLEDYTVRRGQSASYIAILKYGVYNDSIAGVLKSDNPKISDLNVLEVGQVIRIRKEVAPVAATKDPTKRVQLASKKAVVTFMKGTGSVTSKDGVTKPLAVNQMLATGDVVRTEAGAWAELIVDNQTVLRLNQSTEVRLTALQEPRLASSKDTRPFYTRFTLVKGRTWTKVQKWAGTLVHFQVQMPSAIAGVHGTVLENEVAEDSSSSVSVFQGEVRVGPGDKPSAPKSLAPKPVAGPNEIGLADWIQILKTGMRIEVSKDGKPSEPQTFDTSRTDDWTSMNRDRDCLCD